VPGVGGVVCVLLIFEKNEGGGVTCADATEVGYNLFALGLLLSFRTLALSGLRWGGGLTSCF
jgi:hypothetical protein